MNTRKMMALVLLILLAFMFLVGCKGNGDVATITEKEKCGTFKATGITSTSGTVIFYGYLGTIKLPKAGIKYTYTIDKKDIITFNLACKAYIPQDFVTLTGTISKNRKTVTIDEADVICTLK